MSVMLTFLLSIVIDQKVIRTRGLVIVNQAMGS